jgi:hypothetical protein
MGGNQNQQPESQTGTPTKQDLISQEEEEEEHN